MQRVDTIPGTGTSESLGRQGRNQARPREAGQEQAGQEQPGQEQAGQEQAGQGQAGQRQAELRQHGLDRRWDKRTAQTGASGRQYFAKADLRDILL